LIHPRARWWGWRTNRRGTPQLLVAIIAGILIGWLWPHLGGGLKPFADGFIKLIKMLIAPIIFCTVVLGIAHVGDLKSVGRIGVEALIYFEAVTTISRRSPLSPCCSD
jgi:aerobic C4-dicarboxylate transport protein